MCLCGKQPLATVALCDFCGKPICHDHDSYYLHQNMMGGVRAWHSNENPKERCWDAAREGRQGPKDR